VNAEDDVDGLGEHRHRPTWKADPGRRSRVWFDVLLSNREVNKAAAATTREKATVALENSTIIRREGGVTVTSPSLSNHLF
jgi:hypothetical protein